MCQSTRHLEPCCQSAFNVLQDEVLSVPGTSELSDAKSARVLGSEITQAGVAVYDALQHERELQDARQRYAVVVSLPASQWLAALSVEHVFRCW